jgi:putative endonuclease
MTQTWFCYMLHCSDNSLYTGITTDIKRRVAQHNIKKGAKYTQTRLPVRVVWSEAHNTKSEALKRELVLKSLSRNEKLKLIQSP